MGDVGKIGLGIATGGLSTVATGVPGAPGPLGKGLGGGKDGGPTPPDFNAAAEKQGVSSHPNQSNAFGASSKWTLGPDGQWTQAASLGGPLGTGAANLENQIANQGPLGNGDQARNQAITGIYNQATSRLDPQWKQRATGLSAALANQGLSTQDEAGGNAMAQFGRDRNDAYSSAMNNAIAGGTAAQQATFGENLAAQNAPYTQLGTLAGLAQQGPNPAATPYLAGANAQYGGALQNYGINQAGKNSMMGGAASMAPLLLGA